MPLTSNPTCTEDAKSILARMEPMLIRMDERLKNTATKEDVATRPTTGAVIGIAGAALALAALVLGAFVAITG